MFKNLVNDQRLKKGSLEFSWLEKDVLTQVVDQEECNCCYSICSTECLAAYHAIQHEDLHRLSNQDLIDNVHQKFGLEMDDDPLECGATLDHGFMYLMNPGAVKYEEYPFIKQRGVSKTHQMAGKPRMKCEGYKFQEDVAASDDKVRALVRQHPIVATIKLHSEDENFHDIGAGIYSEPSPHLRTEAAKLQGWRNHGVLVVGYGYEEGYYYYLIKNSHGEDWGIDGFGKVTPNMLWNVYWPTGTTKFE